MCTAVLDGHMYMHYSNRSKLAVGMYSTDVPCNWYAEAKDALGVDQLPWFHGYMYMYVHSALWNMYTVHVHIYMYMQLTHVHIVL